MKKRDFLTASLAALGLAGTARGQSSIDRTLLCTDTKRLLGDVDAVSRFSTGEKRRGLERDVRNEYGSLTVRMRYPVSRNDGFQPNPRTLSFMVYQPSDSRGTQMIIAADAADCPTVSCTPEEDIQIRFRLDGEDFGRYLTSKSKQIRIDSTERQLQLTQDQLRAGGTLWIEVASRRGWERGELRGRDIDASLKEAEAFHRGRLRTALEDGAVCLIAPAGTPPPPCYLTTLVTYMLGRPQSCFELRMLSRLTESFSKHEEIMQQYVENAMQVGSQNDDPVVRFAMYVTYVLFIWPAALMIRVGGLTLGGLWYFGGFTLLRGVAWVRRQPVLGAQAK